MIASPDIKTPEQHFASLAEPRRGDVRALHEAICKTIPKHKPERIGGFLGYGKYRYRHESGREGGAGAVMQASQKGKVSTGRCCLRFKKPEDLDLKVAMELVKETAKRLRQSATKAGSP